ncbi:MAG: DUF6036 family nucleotidyltransferase [Elusimicrobiota bacterium]|nr:DUF6036 family nucleotidyltransferase [Elusimicrobiota bacterium]
MTFAGKDEIDRVLSALGEHLAAQQAPPLDLLVCGGSALHALRLVKRTTKDVDIIALVKDETVLNTAKTLPSYLLQAAKKVERDFQLKEDWLNSGPASALDLGLPAGVLGRAETIAYGTALTVRFISRYDQVHFKLYAAVDQGGKHYDDLLALKPKPEELEEAARWSMTHDVSEGYRGEIKRIITEMGHPDVAQRL